MSVTLHILPVLLLLTLRTQATSCPNNCLVNKTHVQTTCLTNKFRRSSCIVIPCTTRKSQPAWRCTYRPLLPGETPFPTPSPCFVAKRYHSTTIADERMFSVVCVCKPSRSITFSGSRLSQLPDTRHGCFERCLIKSVRNKGVCTLGAFGLHTTMKSIVDENFEGCCDRCGGAVVMGRRPAGPDLPVCVGKEDVPMTALPSRTPTPSPVTCLAGTEDHRNHREGEKAFHVFCKCGFTTSFSGDRITLGIEEGGRDCLKRCLLNVVEEDGSCRRQMGSFSVLSPLLDAKFGECCNSCGAKVVVTSSFFGPRPICSA